MLQYGQRAPLEQTNTRASGQNWQKNENVPEGWKILPMDGNFESSNSNTQISENDKIGMSGCCYQKEF
jgi:hypothetical protein